MSYLSHIANRLGRHETLVSEPQNVGVYTLEGQGEGV